MASTAEDAPLRQPKTIVLCFDGTSNEYNAQNSNVVKLFSLLQKQDPTQQVCYYQAGVGTYFAPGVVSPLFRWGAKILDEAFAWYLYAHIFGGYEFLMQNYAEGDRVCLFGFSRGAYTARALAGMLHKVGLLPANNTEQVPFAYKIYSKTDQKSVDLAAGFKRTFCRDVKVEFVGVWDTVSSVGIVMSRDLPFSTSNTTIKTFRQALALDEHRVKFIPSLYPRPSPNPEADPHAESRQSKLAKGKTKAELPELPKTEGSGRDLEANAEADGQVPLWRRVLGGAPPKPKSRALLAPSIASAASSSTDPAAPPTDVLQVWFAGVHTDVGGGSVADAAPHALANITLRWMVRQIALAQAHVRFDAGALALLALTESATATAEGDPSGEGDAGSDAADAVAPAAEGGGLHDQLKADPAWWALEVLPMPVRVQDAAGVWKKNWQIHFGRGRAIADPAPRFHVTVKERMADASLKYVPKAVWKKGTEVYVE